MNQPQTNDELVLAIFKEKKKDESDAEFARRIGLDTGQLSRLKSGDMLPTKTVYEAVAGHLPQLTAVLHGYMAKRAL